MNANLPPTDEEGFLLDPSDWNKSLAETLAKQERIEMTEEHWMVVDYVRDYFEQRESVPELRVVMKHLKEALGEQKATRRYVYQLFPFGYGQQACKIAGMRKPRKLMLDV